MDGGAGNSRAASPASCGEVAAVRGREVVAVRGRERGGARARARRCREMPVLVFLLIFLQLLQAGISRDGESPGRMRTTAAGDDGSADEEFCAASGIFFRQLLAGRDFARPGDAKSSLDREAFRFAKQMKNYVYLLGDRAWQGGRRRRLLGSTWNPEDRKRGGFQNKGFRCNAHALGPYWRED